MKRIVAPLPALGTISVDFRNEAFRIIEMMGEIELRRLRGVSHLGLVSRIFPGASHSREEYMLLQCAVVSLVAKLFKGDERFAVANRVKINGGTGEVTSGEILLKIWALLGNYGHTKFTYGVERSLMSAARRNQPLLHWLTQCRQIPDIQKWARKTILEGREADYHYVIALSRLNIHAEREPTDYLRNLLLPAEELLPKDQVAQYKLNRLKDLFRQIRLLCIATLDSHYSHQPISINLNSAILSLAHFSPTFEGRSGLERTLASTNTWLAEELYLHPRSCAGLKAFENSLVTKIAASFENAGSEKARNGLLKQLLYQGLESPPPADALLPIVRLKFWATDSLFDAANLDTVSETIQEHLTVSPHSFASLNKNPFNNAIYLDLFRSPGAPMIESAKVFSRLSHWLIKVLDQQVTYSVQRVVPNPPRRGLPLQQYRVLTRVFTEREIRGQLRNMLRLFNGFVQLILPITLKPTILQFAPTAQRQLPIMVKFTAAKGDVFDNVTSELETALTQDASVMGKERLQELKAISRLTRRSKAPFMLVCPEKFVLRNAFDETDEKDEWDGIIMECYDSEIRFTIVEAKTGRTPRGRENSAYKQLDKTRELLDLPFGIRYSRKRIKGLGAYLRFSFPIVD